MQSHRLAISVFTVMILGVPLLGDQVAWGQVGDPRFNSTSGTPSHGGPFVNPALLPKTNPWTTPPKKRSMADRAESVLARNPLATAWSNMKDRRRAKQAQSQSRANRFQRDKIAIQNETVVPTPELFVSAAVLSEQRGQIEQAREQYTKALTMAPNHVGARLGAARMEDRLGNLGQAEELYRQVVGMSPQDTTALNDLALCLARQRRFDESAQLLERTVQLNPQKPLYRNNLATVLIELNRDNEALAQLIAAHGPAVGNFNLGHLLSKNGRRAEAAEYYAKAAQIDPNLTQARAALAALASQPTNHPQVARKPIAPAVISQSAALRTLPPVAPTWMPQSR